MERMLMETFSNLNSKGEPFDLKLNEKIFKNKERGFFIELGAFDGLIQSNTAFFEKYKNWTGVLVEPSKNRYEECVKNRPNSICFNYICSSKNMDVVYMNEDDGLMAKVINEESKYTFKAVTLESLLNGINCNFNIDFLSLDVEGYEFEVLKGLNLNKYRPNYMLIELWTSNEKLVCEFLEKNNYDLLENFSNYNRIDNPTWGHNGETHNDFLFVDKVILK